MESLEIIARKKLETMEAGDIRRLITMGKSSWSRGQNMTTKIDKIAKNEADLFQGDDELIELLVLEQVVKEKIRTRMNNIISKFRVLPYQISDRGIRIHLEDYNQELLQKAMSKADLDFEPDYYNEVAYIKPISKFKTAEGSLSDIIPVLECALLKENEELARKQVGV